jgi:hypothetical protein
MAAIKFQTNVPVELALRSLAGELVDSQFGGQQYRFTADLGVFYVSEPVGDIIHNQVRKLGVVVGECIEICKREVSRNGRKSIQWEVAKVGFSVGEQPDGTFAIAAPAAVEPASDLERKLAASIAEVQARKAPAAAATAAPGMVAWQASLLSQTNALTDVYAAALQHASAQHGNAIKADDIRSLMLSAFINLAKGGNQRAA